MIIEIFTSILTLISLLVVTYQVYLLKKIAEEESYPYISLFLTVDWEDARNTIFIVLANTGKTPAYDISIDKILSPLGAKFKLPVLPTNINYLAPSNEFKSYYFTLDSQDRDESLFNQSINVVWKSNINGHQKTFSQAFSIDLTTHIEYTYVNSSTFLIAEKLGHIDNHLKGIKDANIINSK